MVGIKQFDEEMAVQAAMLRFWEHGFEATAMADLAHATGVQRGSLYNAYGGKEGLLLKALERYALLHGKAVHEALEHAEPPHAMQGMLDAHLARMHDPANPPGCLVCNTALECIGRHATIERMITEHFRTAESAIYRSLLRAQRAGNLPPGEDLRALARYFLGVTRGMAVMHRAYGGDLGVVRDMARTALRVLDRSPSASA